MTCAQLWTKTLTSISQKICYVKSGFQILCAVEEFSSLFSRLFSLMQLNWVQTIFHKDTGCLCHWEKTIMPGKLLCLSRQIIQKASSAHHNFFCRKVDFLSFKKRPIINLYISLFNVSVFEPLQKKRDLGKWWKKLMWDFREKGAGMIMTPFPDPDNSEIIRWKCFLTKWKETRVKI